VSFFLFFYRRDAVLEDRAREAEDGLFGEREGHVGYYYKGREERREGSGEK
jgi:hypothetical protein